MTDVVGYVLAVVIVAIITHAMFNDAYEFNAEQQSFVRFSTTFAVSAGLLVLMSY